MTSLSERAHSEDLDINGRIIYVDLSDTGLEDVDWIRLAQDREQ
jgi:hypothetical protein